MNQDDSTTTVVGTTSSARWRRNSSAQVPWRGSSLSAAETTTLVSSTITGVRW
jgi:hypothetical protein